MHQKQRSISIYERFLFSFLAVLLLPVIAFSTAFFYYNQINYQNKTVERAEQSMENSISILEGNLDNLYATMSYHSNMRYMQDKIVQKDVLGTDIPDALSSETATNTFLDGICYYNSLMPKRIYTESGTFDIAYYSEHYLNMSHEGFLETVVSIRNRGWISVQEADESDSVQTLRLYYVVRGRGKSDYWLFKISKLSLQQIFFEEDVEAILLNADEQPIFTDIKDADVDLQQRDIIELKSGSKRGDFILLKFIDKGALSREMRFWRNCFLAVILLITLLGVLIVVILTNKQIKPVYELRDYCAGKSMVIPENSKGLSAYLYVIKDMDMQIEMLNELKRKECLLLQVLWDANSGESELSEKLKNEGLFINTKYYRVIVAMYPEDGKRKLENYGSLKSVEEFEVHAIDTLTENTCIIIVGMQSDSNTVFEEELRKLVKAGQTEIPNAISLFVGEQVEGVSQIRSSYRQALLCGKDALATSHSGITFYTQPKIEKKSGNDEHLIERVCKYIDDNICLYDLSVSFVSEQFGISISNLSHQFKRQMNRTILEYINERKFAYAASLLRETDYSVLMISTMLGYSQPASFIKKFGSLYGMTPNNYRLANKIDEEQHESDQV